MKNEKSEYDWLYAYNTFATGTRPFDGISIMLKNTVHNFKQITNYPSGDHSSTYDIAVRNAVSDTAIVMSYSLLEGFFHEEFKYYMKAKDLNNKIKLCELIKKLLQEHKITLKDWESRQKKIDVIRKLRNKVAHSNGIIMNGIKRNEWACILGEDVFEASRDYPRLSLEGSIALIGEFKKIADEYAEAVFMRLDKV